MNNRNAKRPILPFFIEFVKFSAGFAALIALSLLALRFLGADGSVAASVHLW